MFASFRHLDPGNVDQDGADVLPELFGAEAGVVVRPDAGGELQLPSRRGIEHCWGQVVVQLGGVSEGIVDAAREATWDEVLDVLNCVGILVHRSVGHGSHGDIWLSHLACAVGSKELSSSV